MEETKIYIKLSEEFQTLLAVNRMAEELPFCQIGICDDFPFDPNLRILKKLPIP